MNLHIVSFFCCSVFLDWHFLIYFKQIGTFFRNGSMVVVVVAIGGVVIGGVVIGGGDGDRDFVEYLLVSMYNLQLIKMRTKPNVAKNAPSHNPKFISSNMVVVIVDLLLVVYFSFYVCYFWFFNASFLLFKQIALFVMYCFESVCSLICFLKTLFSLVNSICTWMWKLQTKNRFTLKVQFEFSVN